MGQESKFDYWRIEMGVIFNLPEEIQDDPVGLGDIQEAKELLLSSKEVAIKVKLDQLAEYEAQRDMIEINKRALLDDVKIPEEVEAIMADGMKRMSEVENSFQPALKEHREKVQAQLALVVIPDEIKEALAEIDNNRRLIVEEDVKFMTDIRDEINSTRLALNADIQAQTHQVYAAIAQRKGDIEAEFSGSRQAVDANIEKLKEEIRVATKEIGYTVEGAAYQAIFVKGKKTWNAKRLDAYVEHNPEIKSCYDVGDPSITIRKV
jgi:hypothetical protein